MADVNLGALVAAAISAFVLGGLRFGRPEQADTARAEFNRAEKVVRESTCGE